MPWPQSAAGAPAPRAEDVAQQLRTLGVAPGSHLLVALSGGADSVVLLHLLRAAAPGLHLRLSAAHFDHAMRPGSQADADWVEGLCRAWSVPLERGRAGGVLRSEADARDARYAFLRRAQLRAGAAHLATAHHADDQAETVLLRIARGTGVRGLAGIPVRGPGGLIRPLLRHRRNSLRAYAEAHHLAWREDPTNLDLRPARNRVRLLLLPVLEDRAPGTVERLAQLAAGAGELDAALERRARRALERVAREREGGVLLERAALATYDSLVATRALRQVLRRFGTVLDRPGTRTALQFISSAPSGSRLVLPGGRAAVQIEFGRARVAPWPAEAGPDLPLEIRGERGEGTARIGGRQVRVRWRTGGRPEANELALDASRAPLQVRGWAPGDLIRTAGGTKRLKKLFNQARIPRTRRSGVPVVCDWAGRVVWVAGVARAADLPEPREPALILTILDA